MDKLKIYRLTSIIMLVVASISLLFVYYTHQLPTSVVSTIKLANYSHNAEYEYIANLKPNIIYNKTILKTGEEPIYTSILNYLDITMDYSFTSSQTPTNFSATQEYIIRLSSPEKWNRTLTTLEAKEIFNMSHASLLSLHMNHTSIMQLLRKIDVETGVHSNTYTITIIPIIRTKAVIFGRYIDETFIPEAVIKFKSSSDTGSFITIEGVKQSKKDSITSNTVIEYPWVEQQRSISYLLSAISVSLLGISVYMYNMKRPRETKNRYVNKTMKKYKHLITESNQSLPSTSNIIQFDLMEDLVKTAEILAKPIVHGKKGDEDIYYIVDGNIMYQFIAQRTSAI